MKNKKKKKLLELLKRYKCISRETISKILDIHPRSVSRYIKELKKEFPNMQLSHARGRGYIIKTPPKINFDGFFSEEILLLILALKGLTDLSIEERKMTIDKLLYYLLDKEAKTYIQNLTSKGYIGSNAFLYHKIAKIFEAYLSQTPILFDYISPKSKEKKKHGIYVLGINVERGKIYVTGLQTKTGFVTNYRVRRMENIYIYPKKEKIDFDYESFIQKNVKMFTPEKKYDITIKLPLYLKDSVLDKFPDAKIRKAEDDFILASFPSHSLEGTFYWLWQLGAQCKVISPPELVEKFKKEILNLKNIYFT